MTSLLQKLKVSLFPPDITCDVCFAELSSKTRFNLCGACLQQLPFVGESFCLVCGTALSDEANYCIRCQNTKSTFRVNRAPLLYEGLAVKMILSLKYNSKKYIASTLAALMCDSFISNAMQEPDFVTCVAMTSKELKQRGFNQSMLLAKEVSRRLNIPFENCLIKVKETKTQKKLTAKERAENLENAFVAIPDVKGKKILLVDDVFTTGSTANACARALHKSKAVSVDTLTAAVTPQKIFML